MKLYVGLGNPGSEYTLTRHNAGFMCIDAFAKHFIIHMKANPQLQAELGIVRTDSNDRILLLKPQTFMNNSGVSVKKTMDFYKIALDDIIIIHDDLDLALGSYKIQKGIGPKVHNGVSSVEEHLKDSSFMRIRIGVDNRKEMLSENQNSESIPGKDFVLMKMNNQEGKVLSDTIKSIVQEIL